MSKNKNKLLILLKKPKVERAIKTFIEVFSSYIAVNIMTVDLTSKIALYGLIAGAIGSAISVVLNLKTTR
jgi:hypothetical protein